jgi:hypothetical protein
MQLERFVMERLRPEWEAEDLPEGPGRIDALLDALASPLPA